MRIVDGFWDLGSRGAAPRLRLRPPYYTSTRRVGMIPKKEPNESAWDCANFSGNCAGTDAE